MARNFYTVSDNVGVQVLRKTRYLRENLYSRCSRISILIQTRSSTRTSHRRPVRNCHSRCTAPQRKGMRFLCTAPDDDVLMMHALICCCYQTWACDEMLNVTMQSYSGNSQLLALW